MAAEPPHPRLELVRGDRMSIEPEGFPAIYAEHHDFVRRTVRALGVPDHAADDITQDVFIVVHRRLPEFDRRAPIKAWVFGITRNLARKYRERQDRQRPQLQLVHGRAPGRPDEVMQWREAADVVERFLERLDEDKRAVFVLAELEGMTAPEVAEALGAKLNTVYSRLRAGRALFARAVARAEAQRQRRTRS
jgi:RNA polymerase sigma-70 factor (ECF subfamily)